MAICTGEVCIILKEISADWVLRELDDLQSGAIQKATLVPGEGDDTPAEGDLVGHRITPILSRPARTAPGGRA